MMDNNEIYLISNQTELLDNRQFNTATVQDVYDYFSRRDEVEVDTETEGYDPHTKDILTLQLGNFDRQFVIDIETVDIQDFKELLEDRDKLFLLQNAKFDLRFFMKYGINIKRIYDTFLAECILTTGHNNRKLGLDALAKKYADAQLDKSVRGQIHYKGLTERVIEYAAHDVKYLGKIKEGQLPKLIEYDFANPEDLTDKHTLLGLENRVVRVFVHMEYNGVNIDQQKWESNSKQIEEDLDAKQEELDEIVKNEDKLQSYVPETVQGDLFGYTGRLLNINYGSPKQKINILQDLGLDVDSSADDVLQKHQDFHPFVSTLRDFNGLNKLESSFGMGLLKELNRETGKFHPDYWQILRTGRISVSEPNTNQIPSKGKYGPMIRSAFVPQSGYKMVGGDYSQMELRELAHFSKDPLWLEIFRDPSKDMHSILCSQTFDIPVERVNEPFPDNPDITYRDIQKAINYGLAYGMSAYKLAKTMNCSEERAQAIIDAFFRKVPKVKQKLEQFGDFATNNGYIITAPPYKRRRWFPEFKEYKYLVQKHRRSQLPWDELQRMSTLKGQIERAGKNTPIQGTNADITKLAMVNAYEYIEKHNVPANILLSVYDELQTEAREDIAEEWRRKLQKIMEEAGEMIVTSVPIECECEIANYWDH